MEVRTVCIRIASSRFGIASATAGTPFGKRSFNAAVFVPGDVSVTVPFINTLSPIDTVSSW